MPIHDLTMHRCSFAFSETDTRLCQFESSHAIRGVREGINPLIVPQGTINASAFRNDDLDRNFDAPIEKPMKLHSQKLITPLMFWDFAMVSSEDAIRKFNAKFPLGRR